MKELVILIIYACGVYMAYFHLQSWAERKSATPEEFHTVFQLSLLSWLVYPLYGLMYLFKECEGD
jgi:hypothetical protein